MAMGLVGETPQISQNAGARRFSFHGVGGTLFGIQIVNLFLSILTLGLFSFWGRVKVRKYMMSQTEFEGDRFAYHGNGKELLIGWIKAVVFLGIPFLLLMFLSAGALAYVIVAAFMPVAVVSARRYRLSRSSWRSIRFSFRGRVWDFALLSAKGWLVSAVTLGIAYPVWQNWRQGFLVSHSYFGNQKFDYHGRGGDLVRSFLLHLLLTIPTLGLNWFWYWARLQRYYWNHTSFGAARFNSDVRGGGIFGLMFVNLLLLLVTLGLAWSWVQVRNARYYAAHLTLDGALDLAAVLQDAQTASATGEALSGFFDLDFDLG